MSEVDEAAKQVLHALGDFAWANYNAGAAVAFGLMGMAEAIRWRTVEYNPRALPCWTATKGFGSSAGCEVCGAYSQCTNYGPVEYDGPWADRFADGGGECA